MAKSLQHQVILRALEIISDEGKWTEGALARDHHRRSCQATAPEAVRFCAIGALERAAYELLGEIAEPLFVTDLEKTVLNANGYASLTLAQVNDQKGREAVIELFKKALAR